jgi:hypothetical protein
LRGVWGSTEEQLWRQPPVGDIDGFLGLLESNGNSPEVISTIYVPLDVVASAHWEVRFEAILLGDGGSLVVTSLFMFFVVSVIFVELNICKSLFSSASVFSHYGADAMQCNATPPAGRVIPDLPIYQSCA